MRPVSKCQRKRRLDFAAVTRSFTGYLEGTGKSLHTIKNYRCDLVTFWEFLDEGLGSAPVSLDKVTRKDLERYHEFLKSKRLRANSRRRKLLTIRRLIRFLSKRNQLDADVADRLPAPARIERIPLTVPYSALLERIRALPRDTAILARNRALLWVLTETGCLVSEVTRLRFDDFRETQQGCRILFSSPKALREVFASEELLQAVRDLRRFDSRSPWAFLGFNRYGSMGAPITPRGVELLVRAYSPRLELEELTPRTFRHSAVLQWMREGLPRDEIQKRLGLRTAYAFRIYDALV